MSIRSVVGLRRLMENGKSMTSLRPRQNETVLLLSVAGAERLVIGQAREIAEEPMETTQPARLDCSRALAGAAPLGRDLMIEKGEARIAELQQPQTQEAGDLDCAVRIL